MNKEQLIEEMVLSTDTSKKLYSLLEKIFEYKDTIENVIIMLKNDKNKQKMIEFLESGETDKDRIYYRTAELNRGISLL